ncbi:conserved hypothetical protein [Burkholderia vietnamiensis]|nr:conserved hypothetical protein [Burkholderia vietnamiensis]CAG9255240.1 conserved hypothetical protein [Burkholderia diffusa]SOT46060.1 hypothetical protein F01_570046 [Burkholderia cenocepacia]
MQDRQAGRGSPTLSSRFHTGVYLTRWIALQS